MTAVLLVLIAAALILSAYCAVTLWLDDRAVEHYAATAFDQAEWDDHVASAPGLGRVPAQRSEPTPTYEELAFERIVRNEFGDES